MTLYNTNLQFEFVGFDEMLETDITEEEIEEEFEDDVESVRDAFGLFEILEIVLDARDKDYVYSRVTNYEDHFKVYELEADRGSD